MSAARAQPQHPPRRRALVALLTAFSFGCTTLRAPVSTVLDPVPVRGGVADPQLELWLESADPITPEEGTRATAEARAALEQALAGRQVGPDQLLVVRAQGVARTASHRRDQTAAVVGLVVTAVVVVVAVVWWMTKGGSGGDGGGAPSATPAPRAAPRGPAPSVSPALAGGRPPTPASFRPPQPAPRPPPPGAAAALRPPPPGTSRPPVHHGGSGAGHVGLDVSAHLVFPLGVENAAPGEPVILSQRVYTEADAGPGAPTAGAGDPGQRQAEAASEGAGPWAAPPEPLTSISLPPLPPFDAAERGFFDGDAVLLELTLVDRVTGAPRWVKTVEAGGDLRDAKQVGALLDRALAEAVGWAAVP